MAKGELRLFFFSSRRRHTRSLRDWSSDVCSSDLHHVASGGKRCEHIRPVLEGAGLPRMAVEPTAAVNVDNEWAGSRGTPRVREVQIESERSKPCNRGEIGRAHV